MVIYQLYMKLSTQTGGEANRPTFPFCQSPPIINKLVLCLCSSANMDVYITHVRSYVNDNLSLPCTPFSYRLQFHFCKALLLEKVLNDLCLTEYNMPSLFIVVTTKEATLRTRFLPVLLMEGDTWGIFWFIGNIFFALISSGLNIRNWIDFWVWFLDSSLYETHILHLIIEKVNTGGQKIHVRKCRKISWVWNESFHLVLPKTCL